MNVMNTSFSLAYLKALTKAVLLQAAVLIALLLLWPCKATGQSLIASSEQKQSIKTQSSLPSIIGSNLPKLNTTTSIDFRKVSLGEALQTIAESGGLQLSYREEYVASAKKVTVKLEEVTVLEALFDVLRDTDLRLNISRSGHLILVPKAPVQEEMHPYVSSGPGGKLTGVVTDASSGDPLPGVNVAITELGSGAATDPDGVYVILNVPPGTYALRASMIGYADMTVTDVRVKIDQTTTIDFEMQEATIMGEEVIVTAERPDVELDLTASKVTISGVDLQNSWVRSIDDALRMQSGINVNGGIRGGFQMDVNYIVDGQVVRDDGSNMSLMPINTTSIQEMEVLTGGWNAEYPQANSGVVNVVTKRATSRHTGTVRYRLRPPGLYHWGRQVYSEENYEYWERNLDGSPGLNSLEYWQKNDGGADIYKNMTPEGRLENWRRIIAANDTLRNYDERTEWEMEATLTGPLVKGLGYFISGRYLQGVPVYATGLKYNPTYNFQAKLDYDLTNRTRIVGSVMHYQFTNSGPYRTAYLSSEDATGAAGNAEAYFYSPYSTAKFWPYGAFSYGGGERLGRIQPPEKVWQWNGQVTATHLFSDRTFLDIAGRYQWFRRHSSFSEWFDRGYYSNRQRAWGVDAWGPVCGNNVIMNNGIFQNFCQPSDLFHDNTYTGRVSISAALTSQATDHHQFKAGAEFSRHLYRRLTSLGFSGNPITTNYLDPTFRPWEVGAFIQDKIEIKGMIVNAGVRIDMFNVNKKVGPSIFDPVAMYQDGQMHPEDIQQGVIMLDYDSPLAKSTPTRIAVSPRIGISHPITETTVLHFMYGHFNQRPAWFKLAQYGAIQQQPRTDATTWNDSTGFHVTAYDPDSRTFWYNTSALGSQFNPGLTYEKYVQYEVGFEQNVANIISFDATLYYKEGKNLTSLGFQRGYSINNMGLTGSVTTRLDPDPPNAQIKQNAFLVPINGGWVTVRGLEFDVESRFSNWINFRAVYNMSAALSDRYGASRLYQDWGEPGKAGTDQFYGGGNNDKGAGGNKNEVWNPLNTLRFTANFATPPQFGPSLGGLRLLGDWFASVYHEYASGQLYTYHSALNQDFSTKPNNKRWKPRHVTNLRVSKSFDMVNTSRLTLSLDVINLFNNKQLRMLSGQELVDYEEYGKLPVHPVSQEPNVWEWYMPNLLPRQTYFGATVTF